MQSNNGIKPTPASAAALARLGLGFGCQRGLSRSFILRAFANRDLKSFLLTGGQ